MSRANRYRGGRRNHRRLLQDIPTGAPASAPALAPIPAPFDGCLTLMEIIDTHPNLTRLSEATADLPIVRAALSDRTFTDTFFAPTDAAIESFTRWAGFEDVRAGLQELLGDTQWKGYLIAYHAVPDRNLTVDDLGALKGDDRYLEDALEGEMPLLILHAKTGIDDDDDDDDEEDDDDGDDDKDDDKDIDDDDDDDDDEKHEYVVVGLGSTAKIVGEQVVACNGVLHMVDTVLLPFDGDGELDDEQKRRLADAKRALDARYPDRPADIDPEYEYADEDVDVFEYSAATIPDDRVD